jgi:hypothetical protein
MAFADPPVGTVGANADIVKDGLNAFSRLTRRHGDALSGSRDPRLAEFRRGRARARSPEYSVRRRPELEAFSGGGRASVADPRYSR